MLVDGAVCLFWPLLEDVVCLLMILIKDAVRLFWTLRDDALSLFWVLVCELFCLFWMMFDDAVCLFWMLDKEVFVSFGIPLMSGDANVSSGIPQNIEGVSVLSWIHPFTDLVSVLCAFLVRVDWSVFGLLFIVGVTIPGVIINTPSCS